eukprot:m.170513 g.170513  ORF g.170513 m.170513 type:complete len:493 (-) comp53255_c0_seq2:150-1628(-)
MLTSDYTKKDAFNKNFMHCWREAMTDAERKKITKLDKCDFSVIHAFYDNRRQAKKEATKEEKEARKAKEKELIAKYGYAMLDGHREKLANFRIEPPGLFRGRGDHPKMGMLKQRVLPEQITINIGQGAVVPEPPAGHKWKEVKHDNTVTWIANWIENVQQQNKYVMFNADSRMKGRNDMKKFDVARELKKKLPTIRANYQEALCSKEMLERQRATSLYLIDKLALRAGGEKDADEEADTVGCCSLRCEHIKLLEDDQIELDFPGKDSIRYHQIVKVEHQVWKNLRIFMKDPKKADDPLFDRLNTSILNKYLQTIMPGLSAKVFRTCNASMTLQEQLKKTPVDGTVEEKILAYNSANREVAVLCNHQRSVSKTHDQQMEKLAGELADIETEIKETKQQLKLLKQENAGDKKIDACKNKVKRLDERLQKKKVAQTIKDSNKTIALSTSKLNYLDPRISVAWCKKHNVPIDKVYNQTQRKKFLWAIEMTEADFVF